MTSRFKKILASVLMFSGFWAAFGTSDAEDVRRFLHTHQGLVNAPIDAMPIQLAIIIRESQIPAFKERALHLLTIGDPIQQKITVIRWLDERTVCKLPLDAGIPSSILVSKCSRECTRLAGLIRDILPEPTREELVQLWHGLKKMGESLIAQLDTLADGDVELYAIKNYYEREFGTSSLSHVLGVSVSRFIEHIGHCAGLTEELDAELEVAPNEKVSHLLRALQFPSSKKSLIHAAVALRDFSYQRQQVVTVGVLDQAAA